MCVLGGFGEFLWHHHQVVRGDRRYRGRGRTRGSSTTRTAGNVDAGVTHQMDPEANVSQAAKEANVSQGSRWQRGGRGGVGGNAVVEGVALIPLGIESIRGVLETTVVQGDVPLLLPVRLLVTLAAKIDLKNMIMELQNHQVEVPLHPLYQAVTSRSTSSRSRPVDSMFLGKPGSNPSLR